MVHENGSVGDPQASGGARKVDIIRALPPGSALPLRVGHLTMPDLIDLYLRHYQGRDSSRLQRLSWWSSHLAGVRLDELSDDEVHAGIESLAQRSASYFAGQDVLGAPIYRSKHRPLAPATVNRYLAALASVLTWAIKSRITPRGFTHPCRTVHRRPENNEKTRFLSDEERQRLLTACRQARWPKLYLLVLLAVTTGARKGELLALRWQDLDLDRALAYCQRTKNGDAKALPLVPAVVEELRRFVGSPSVKVFASNRPTGKAFAFENQWRLALKAAKLRNFRFHDLRHTCASMLAQNGATLLEIGDVLGHRQLQMTKRYSHLTTGHKAALVNRVLGEIR